MRSLGHSTPLAKPLAQPNLKGINNGDQKIKITFYEPRQTELHLVMVVDNTIRTSTKTQPKGIARLRVGKCLIHLDQRTRDPFQMTDLREDATLTETIVCASCGLVELMKYSMVETLARSVKNPCFDRWCDGRCGLWDFPAEHQSLCRRRGLVDGINQYQNR